MQIAFASHHAARRAQQRAIPAAVVDVLLDYGDRLAAGGGAEIVRLSARVFKELAVELIPATWRRHARTLRTAYAVVGADGTVITVGHRFRRVERR